MNPREESEVYPKPPHYYKLFAQSSTALPPPNLEEFEKYKSFSCFGMHYPFSGEMPTMEENGVEKLEKKFDPHGIRTPKDNLLHLLNSLMANTFQLLRFLEVCPKRVGEKVEDIDLIIKNMMYMLNSFRRKQCLYNLIEYLNKKKDQRAGSGEALKDMLGKIKGDLSDIIGEEGNGKLQNYVHEGMNLSCVQQIGLMREVNEQINILVNPVGTYQRYSNIIEFHQLIHVVEPTTIETERVLHCGQFQIFSHWCSPLPLAPLRLFPEALLLLQAHRFCLLRSVFPLKTPSFFSLPPLSQQIGLCIGFFDRQVFSCNRSQFSFSRPLGSVSACIFPVQPYVPLLQACLFSSVVLGLCIELYIYSNFTFIFVLTGQEQGWRVQFRCIWIPQPSLIRRLSIWSIGRFCLRNLLRMVFTAFTRKWSERIYKRVQDLTKNRWSSWQHVCPWNRIWRYVGRICSCHHMLWWSRRHYKI
eukprot:TRINITY_DN105012_c2_g1_i1.p1 TRINITY_DN105012_c2_g1~~TRINITY_DN105012_c2_g1_i1.p1  ORF type:complete len:471 (-),score=-8.07 TRINITY_DN105012_c2_g1_i1:819-2231(-)